MVDKKLTQISMLNLIKKVEKSIYCNKWSAFGVNLWPIIRISLSYFIKDDTGDSNKKKPDRKKFLFKVFLNFKRSINVLKSFFKTLYLFYKCRNKKYIYMTNGISFEQIDNVWKDKYYTGLSQKFNLTKKNCLFISPVSLKKKFSAGNDIFSIEWLSYLCCNLSKLYLIISGRRVKLNDYEKFLEIIKKSVSDTTYYEEDNIIHKAMKINFLVKFFSFFIKFFKFEKVFILCFYHDIGFALNIACHNLSVDSYDIQHGVMCSHHVYEMWDYIPRLGYKEMPKFFLTWDQISSESVNNWSKKTDYHRVLETGNFSHYIWKKDSYISLRYDSFFNSLKKEMKIKDCFFDVIVTLQPIIDFQDDWDRLAEIIKDNSLNVRWWIRHHPTTMNDGRSSGIKNISSISLPNVDYDNASNLPLCSLLRNVDLHITVSSSTFLECVEFGVKTLFISECGKFTYDRSRIDFLYAINKNEIIKSIHKMMYFSEKNLIA